MQINDLKTGDVLLFSPEKGSFVSWAITFLTDSKVSHSAVFYNSDNKTIIEETPPQVAVSDAASRFEERIIYVCRLKESLDMSPVVSAATNYLNNEEPYDNTGLYFVGALLIYKKFTPNTEQQKIIIQILKKITASIVEHINEKKEPGKLPMVCSQFVAQCYQDAGDKYKLQVKNGVLSLKSGVHQKASMLDQAIALHTKHKEGALLLKSNEMKTNQFPSDEELCKELKDAFSATNSQKTAASLSPELVDAIANFGKAHQLISTSKGLKTSSSPFKTLQDQENMFVTPADLLSNCVNLEQIGTIE